MKTAVKSMQAVFFSPIVAAIILSLLFEFNVIEEGVFAGDDMIRLEFQVQTIMMLLTLVVIPLALRLFKFKTVAKKVSGNIDGWRRMSVVRTDMLALSLMLNVLAYYMFINVSFGYLALITLLAMAFIFPTKERCKNETGIIDEE